MMLLRQSARAIIAVLFLSIATTTLLKWINRNWQAIAADEQAQLTQELSSARTDTVEEDYITRLFDLSGRELAQFEGRFYRFSSDGQRLLTRSSSFQFHYLFNVSGTRLLRFRANTAQFSSDGQRMVTTFNGITYLYDAMGQKLVQLPGSQGTSIFSPNNQQLIILTDDRAYLLNSSGRQIAQIQGRFIDIGGGFDSTGQRFILYRRSNSTSCDLFNSSGQLVVQLPEECAGVTPDGQRFLLATGTLDNSSLQLYNFSGREIAQFSAASPTFSSDGRFILTTAALGGISSYLYKSSGEEIAQLQGTFGRFSLVGQRLITVSGNTVHLYNLSGNEVAQVPGHLAAFLPGSEKFVAYLSGNTRNQLNSSSGETRLFDGNGRELASLTGSPPLIEIEMFGAGSPSQINGFSQGVLSFFSSDGQRLVTTDAQSSYLYNASGEYIATLPGVFLNFNSTGQHLITVSESKVYLFNRSGTKLMEFEGGFASFSPDGQHLVISAQNTLL